MESVTIKKTHKGVWMQKFDDYETSFRKISKSEALELIEKHRADKSMYHDGDETAETYQLFAYWN